MPSGRVRQEHECLRKRARLVILGLLPRVTRRKQVVLHVVHGSHEERRRLACYLVVISLDAAVEQTGHTLRIRWQQ
jgi:hypothetical protein